MTRVLFDGRGRRWLCSQGGIGAGAEARNFQRGVDEIRPSGSPILHCKCGELRLALPVPDNWRDLADEDLQRMLAEKLRERGI